MSTPATPRRNAAPVGRTVSAAGGRPGNPTVARGRTVGQSSERCTRAWINRQDATTPADTGTSLTGAKARGGAGSRRVDEKPAEAPLVPRTSTTATTVSARMHPTYGPAPCRGPRSLAGRRPQGRPPRRLERRRRHPHHAGDARREPPVPAAEERHQRRDEQGPHDRRVHEDRDREAEAELLQADHPARNEARERGDHHDRRGGDDPPSPLQALGNRARVVPV